MEQLIADYFKGAYVFESLIGEGSVSRVGLMTDTRQKHRQMAVKVFKPALVSKRVEDYLRFKKEALAASRLGQEGLIRVERIDKHNECLIMVMEAFPAKSLAQWLKAGRRFSQEEIIAIALQTAQTLAACHEAGLIHKDIKTSNILYDEQGQLKVIDFGQAQIKEFTTLKLQQDCQNTFGAMAPEQGGIIKKNIDERSDLYSLGAVLYTLACGQPPFSGQTATEMIHAHIAKVPALPGKLNPDLTVMLEKFIMKLLEKDQEDRYQTAQGLINDLERLRAGEESFVLGEKDKIKKLNFRTGLLGRSLEVVHLRQVLQQAYAGQGSVFFIGAESGQGKTRLVEEMRNEVQTQNKVFLQGKFFASHNQLPYGIIKDVLENYIVLYHKFDDARKEQVKSRLKNAAGELGRIILDIHPGMVQLLGSCPPLAPLSADNELKRFITTVVDFLFALSDLEKGLVCFFDDLQWADEGSLSVLQELMQDIARHPLLLLGTYRRDEVGDNHSLKRLQVMAAEAHLPLGQLNLQPLHLEDVEQLVAHVLHDQPAGLRDLAQVIYRQGKGNPFFSLEIIKQLASEQVIFNDEAGWQINTERLQTVSVPRQAVDIIIKRIEKLLPKEKELISLASVIGRSFKLELLFDLTAGTKQEVIDIIDKALELQLLEQDSFERDKLIFVHDRINQAFYESIPEDQRQALHRQVAVALEEKDHDPQGETLFDLAYHYKECGEDEKILHYCYQAGLKAKANYANEDALKYLEAASAVLAKKRSQGSYNQDLWQDCHFQVGEIKLLIGQTDEAIILFNRLLEASSDKMQRAEYYNYLNQAYLKKGEFAKQEEMVALLMKERGLPFPIKKPAVIFSIVKELIIHELHVRFPKFFLDSKKPQNRRHEEIIVKAMRALNWGYIICNLLKYIRGVLFKLNWSETTGLDLAEARTMFGSLLMAIGKFPGALKALESSRLLHKQEGNIAGMAETLQFMGFACQWSGQFRKANEYFQQAIATFKRIGDTREYYMSVNGVMKSNLYLADLKDMPEMVAEYRASAYRTQNHYNIASSYINGMRTAYTLGDYEDALSQGLQGYEHAKTHDVAFLQCKLCFMLGEVYMEQGVLEKARAFIMEAKALYEKNHFLKTYTVYVYNYVAELLLREYQQQAGDKNSKAARRQALSKIGQVCRTAVQKNKAWPVSFGCSLRVMAQYYGLKGQAKLARQTFETSIRHQEKLERVYEQGRSHYEYGLYLKNIGHKDEAQVQLQLAYRCFESIHSSVYMERIKAMVDIPETEQSISQKIINRNRLASIIDVSQSISSILDLDLLLETVVDKATAITGAQRGYLFLKDKPTGDLVNVAQQGSEQNQSLPESEAGVSRSIVQLVLDTQTYILTANAVEDERLQGFEDVRSQNLKSILASPLVHHQQTIGVCYLDNPLVSDVFNEEDLEVLNVLMTQAAISIENATLAKDMVEKKRLEREMELAQQIQTAILPKNYDNPHFEIAGLMQPAEEVGGDYFDYMRDPQGREWFFVGDVTGHGVTPGLIMMMAQSMTNSLVHQPGMDPKQLIIALNQTLYDNIRNRLQANEYMTFVALCHEGGGRFTYAGRHESLLIYRAASGLVEEIQTEGIWLGIKPEIEKMTKTGTVMLQPGDLMLLYTDGVVELRNAAREQYQVQRLEEVMRAQAGESCDTLLQKILKSAMEYMESQEDDITLVAVRRR